MKRLLLTLLFTSAMLVGTLTPAAPADALGGGDKDGDTYSYGDKHDKDDKDDKDKGKDLFPADQVVTYICPDGYVGPNSANQCTRDIDTTVPAEPILGPACPAGFTGPNSANVCTATVPTVEIVTTPADETISFRCLDGFNVDDSDPADVRCTGSQASVTEVPGTTVTSLVCPTDFLGPDAAGDCTRMTSTSLPATPVSESICPANTDSDGSGGCVLTIDDPEITGVILTETPYCPVDFVAELGGTCVRDVLAPTRYLCPIDFDIVGAPVIESDAFVIPPDCVNASNTETARPQIFCEVGLSGPDLTVAEPTCRLTIDAPTTTSAECPAGFAGPAADNSCSRDRTRNIAVDAVVVDSLVCDTGYLGPDANGDCFLTSPETTPAQSVETTVCPAGALGPQANGTCAVIGTSNISVPAIAVSDFSCPAGTTGPDASRQCSVEVDVFETVDAVDEIVGYECVAGIGPDANNDCTITTTDTVDAIEVISYTCPAGAIGPDAQNMCSRPSCTISFYDYPDASKQLFSTDHVGEVNLTGSYRHFNDDVESIAVPHGCSVSVSEHVDGGGWCYSYGGGIHNLADDELSWFSIPSTGCDNDSPDPEPECKPRWGNYWSWSAKGCH